jgi:DNA polymerase III sliding clamp (beta) subunit (PCNA family)
LEVSIVAIAIHTPAESGTPDRPVAVVPVADLRRALSTIRKVMPKPRGRRAAKPTPQLVMIADGMMIAGDPHNAGMVQIPVTWNHEHWGSDPAIVPLDALVAAAKGAKGSVAIHYDRITRLDGTSVAFTVESDAAERADDDADYVMAPMPARAFSITGQQLCDLATIVGSHASGDDTRPVLTGVYLSPVASDGTVDIVATDSYRMMVTSVETGAPATDQHCLVPVRMIRALAAHAAKHPHATVEVRPDADSVTFRILDRDPEGDPGDRMMIIGARTRMIEGQYPNYTALLPDGQTRTVTVSDADADRIIPFARMRTSLAPLVVTVHDSTLSVAWEGAELSVPCSVTGEQDPITFALNAAFAADCITAMPQGGVSIGIIDPLRPFLFTAADPSQDHYNARSLVMPVRV